jgi:hypothetical protein
LSNKELKDICKDFALGNFRDNVRIGKLYYNNSLGQNIQFSNQGLKEWYAKTYDNRAQILAIKKLDIFLVNAIFVGAAPNEHPEKQYIIGSNILTTKCKINGELYPVKIKVLVEYRFKNKPINNLFKYISLQDITIGDNIQSEEPLQSIEKNPTHENG